MPGSLGCIWSMVCCMPLTVVVTYCQWLWSRYPCVWLVQSHPWPRLLPAPRPTPCHFSSSSHVYASAVLHVLYYCGMTWQSHLINKILTYELIQWIIRNEGVLLQITGWIITVKGYNSVQEQQLKSFNLIYLECKIKMLLNGKYFNSWAEFHIKIIIVRMLNNHKNNNQTNIVGTQNPVLLF